MVVPLPDSFWLAEQEALAELLLPLIERAFTTGAGTALATAGVEIDFTVLARNTARMSELFANGVAEELTGANQRTMARVFDEWVRSGEPLSNLQSTLVQQLGTTRARTVATTEVTRAFAESNREVWREAGLEQFRFRTARDDLVCPICEPNEGLVFDMDDDSNTPPLHSRCRCFLQPVVRPTDPSATTIPESA